MKYVSTRSSGKTFEFSEVLLGSYAPDGGLYVPRKVPVFKKQDLAKWQWLPFHELACHVIEPYLGGWIESDQLSRMLEETYAGFESDAIAPLYQTASNEWILELFHGPAGVYQDFGLQLMARLVEYALQTSGKKALVMGCTGGDTGAAAIAAFSGVQNVTVLVLHPAKGLTEEHRRRLLSADTTNVLNIAVDGDYSDCHQLCEQFFRCNTAAQRPLISFNSVNWVRVLAHLSFYFYSALQLGAAKREVAFSVPTGNFGALYAGYIAREMGLPIRQLIVATNANAGLHDFLQTNFYSRSQIRLTNTPSMNVSLASNFERLQWSILNRRAHKVARNMERLEGEGALQLEQAEWLETRKLFDSLAVEDSEAFSSAKEIFARSGYRVSTNTAIGLRAARACRRSLLIPMICLATTRPSQLDGETRPPGAFGAPNPVATGLPTHHCQAMPNDVGALTQFIEALSNDAESLRNPSGVRDEACPR